MVVAPQVAEVVSRLQPTLSVSVEAIGLQLPLWQIGVLTLRVREALLLQVIA